MQVAKIYCLLNKSFKNSKETSAINRSVLGTASPQAKTLDLDTCFFSKLIDQSLSKQVPRNVACLLRRQEWRWKWEKAEFWRPVQSGGGRQGLEAGKGAGEVKNPIPTVYIVNIFLFIDFFYSLDFVAWKRKREEGIDCTCSGPW